MTDGPKVLVTGGAGFIGSHCCRALISGGFQPIVYDNLSTGHRSFVTAPLIEGDLLDQQTLIRAFADHEISAVMHFAAASLVGESVDDPQKYYINNVQGTLSLLQAMRKASCRRIVFSSTGAVYGNADSKALPESFSCAPINPYGASKRMVELMLADYRSAYGFGAFCLRYFNASGADPDGGLGELRAKETHLIPRAMMALQGYLDDFAVFGDDYDTSDGTAIRDYIHVTDLAAAHLAALRLLLGGHAGSTLNLGTGLGFRCARFYRPSSARPAARYPTLSSPDDRAIRLTSSPMLQRRGRCSALCRGIQIFQRLFELLGRGTKLRIR